MTQDKDFNIRIDVEELKKRMKIVRIKIERIKIERIKIERMK